MGKAFLNTKIKRVDGGQINFLTALKRSIFVSGAGMGFGIPFLNLICFLFSYRVLRGRGISTWDQKIGTVILYGQVSSPKVFIAACFPVALLIAGIYI